MKRPVRIAALAALVCAVGAGAAPASTQFSATFSMRYLSPVAGASSGQAIEVHWSDPGEPGGVPKAIGQIRLQFAKGTRLDTSALPQCTATDEEVVAQGASACPPGSVLGTGGTDAAAGPGASFTTNVTLFNAKDQIIVLVLLNGAPITEFRDEVQRDAILVKPVLPPGVSLTRLALTIGRHGSGRRAYMRNPPTCPRSHRWTTVGTFSYLDGSSQTLHSTTPCRG